ncbi:MAG TPA: lysylphosphatidylglycerol synthase domain-containing protein [Mycobacteriales bacterium]|nr:lysylphosphatidylglycerol synthase domain-containing protein [Mycobacteriales bacterium]
MTADLDRPGAPSPVRRLIRAGAVAAALVFVALAVRSQGHEIADGLGRLSIGTVAAAFAAVLGGLVAAAQSWRTLLAGLGSPLPVAVGGRVYLLAQLGKYLPGSLWPMLAQAELGRDHGVPRARSAVAAVAVLVVSLVTGAVVAVGGLALSATGAVRTYWYVGLVPLLGLVALSPPVLSRLLALAFRVLRRPAAQTGIPGGALLVSVAWSVLQWLCFGVQAWLLARGLGGGHDRLLLLATGAFAVAWVVGFLIVFVPAGAGAREAALVLVLGPAVGGANALALALVSRVLLIAGDLLTVAVAVVSARVHARRRPTPFAA